ncbi:hypothetical protein [Burkholderia ambifaria]|uniref:hypothetical protein n=1 Tax=Burkholderia ambifaria TaxID=152480 RepID=UPI001592274A|nr:hypothetical protein [Burkholderia ambifaria]
MRLYTANPQAACLYLLHHYRQLEQGRGRFERGVAVDLHALPEDRRDALADTINKAIDTNVTQYENRVLKPTSAAMATYTKYMTALGQMRTDSSACPRPNRKAAAICTDHRDSRPWRRFSCNGTGHRSALSRPKRKRWRLLTISRRAR